MPTAAHCVGVNLTSVAMSLDSCARLESGTHDPETFTDLCSQQLDFVSSPAINPGQVFFPAMNRTGFKFDHCHIFPPVYRYYSSLFGSEDQIENLVCFTFMVAMDK